MPTASNVYRTKKYGATPMGVERFSTTGRKSLRA